MRVMCTMALLHLHLHPARTSWGSQTGPSNDLGISLVWFQSSSSASSIGRAAFPQNAEHVRPSLRCDLVEKRRKHPTNIRIGFQPSIRPTRHALCAVRCALVPINAMRVMRSRSLFKVAFFDFQSICPPSGDSISPPPPFPLKKVRVPSYGPQCPIPPTPASRCSFARYFPCSMQAIHPSISGSGEPLVRWPFVVAEPPSSGSVIISSPHLHMSTILHRTTPART